MRASDAREVKNRDYLFRRYGGIMGTDFSPISIFTVRYYDKNYGNVLDSIPRNSRILEIGPGGASFTQYLLYKGYGDITVCEVAEDNAQSLNRFLGDRVRIVNKDAVRYLESSSDRFNFIYAAQVIEHFTYDAFVSLLEDCYEHLDEGGYIIFETINCANITHGLYLRYCDYTHRTGFTPRSLKQFFNAVGSFSSVELMEIRPPTLRDCLYYICRRIKGESAIPEIGALAGCSAAPLNSRRGLRRLMAILLRNPGIRLSKWMSYMFLGYYEFENIKVYTPFFAIVARKA